MSNLAYVYAAYLVAAIALVVYHARTLFRNGALFLHDVFPQNVELADAVNRLLLTGFAMANLGYAFFLMKAGPAATGEAAFEILAKKLGTLLVSMAVLHFVNVIVFWQLRHRKEIAHMPPPVAPNAILRG